MPVAVIVLLTVAAAILLPYLSFCIFLFCYVFHRRKKEPDLANDPHYRPHLARIRAAQAYLHTLPCEKVTCQGRDGVPLCGMRYRAKQPVGAVLCFHGYRSTPENNFAVLTPEFLARGYDVFLLRQRGSGESGGRCTTFGARETEDCLCWTEKILRTYAPQRTVLYGISMGGAAVACTADALPGENLALVCDSAFVNAERVLREKAGRFVFLPGWMYWPAIFRYCRLRGFDPRMVDCPSHLARACHPVLFLHGEADRVVLPAAMEENAAAIPAHVPHVRILAPGQGHTTPFYAPGVPERVFAFLDDIFSARGER